MNLSDLATKPAEKENQLSDFQMVGFRHDLSDFGKRLQLFDFDKYLIDPAFCGSWIILGYVFRYLG